MFELEKSNQKIGAYLKELIEKRYPSVRQFCKSYLEQQKMPATDEEIRKMHNRFCQIIKGRKAIQTYDLPIITDLLGVSCEEILTAGKTYIPISGHITNYEIAFSKDRTVWDKYMKREDKLFLNCDEYCKSVIDYALEFKNYAFIKYLMDEGFIWFVDLSKWRPVTGATFGAGTSVKSRKMGPVDNFTSIEIEYEDRLRTQTIALAIENGDTSVLDSLRARELPELYRANIIGYPSINIHENRNDDLIKAIALSKGKILDYFSEEFTVVNMQKDENLFFFPYTGEVIEVMLQNEKKKSAETMIRRAIRHNRSVYDKLKSLTDEARDYYRNEFYYMTDGFDDVIEKELALSFKYDQMSNMVSFNYSPEKHKYKGLVSNIISVDCKSNDSLISELLLELNGIHDSIFTLVKEED